MVGRGVAWARAARWGHAYLGLCSRAAAAWACSAPTDSKAMALTVSASSVSPARASAGNGLGQQRTLCTQLQCLPVDEGWAGGQEGRNPTRMDFQPWRALRVFASAQQVGA